MQADVVFMSPPWGGPQYLRNQLFDVSRGLGELGSLADVLAAARRIVSSAPPHGKLN